MFAEKCGIKSLLNKTNLLTVTVGFSLFMSLPVLVVFFVHLAAVWQPVVLGLGRHRLTLFQYVSIDPMDAILAARKK